MLLTEEEARTKWCHRVLRDPRDGSSIAPGQCCITFECMAWRQGWKANPAYVSPDNYWPDRRAPEQQAPRIPDETTGFCGLAGKPE